MIDITALGELLIDFTQEGSQNGYPLLQAHPGGAPANFLAAANMCGAATAMVGKVGKDSFGKLLKTTLAQTGINVTGLTEDENVFTTLAFVTLDNSGDRSFSFARKPGADTCLTDEDIPYRLLDETRVLHFGTLSFTNEPSRSACMKAVEYAKKKGKIISFDPNFRSPLWKSREDAIRAIKWGLAHADIVKISDDEIELVTGEQGESALKKLMDEYDCQLVFLTMGREGCMAQNLRGFVRVPNYENAVTVDTTGAGDIFGGTAVAFALKEKEAPADIPEEALRRICRVCCTAASLSTEKHGGISSVPDISTVLHIIEERK